MCRLNGKIAIDKAWQKSPYLWPEEIPAFIDRCPNGQFGVVLSNRDLVIDVDPRNFKPGDKPLARLLKEIGWSKEQLIANAATVKTGSGGFHIYLRLPKNIKIRHRLPDFLGLEFKSRGHYVVGASGIHPTTGQPYVWCPGQMLKTVEEAPPALLAVISKRPSDTSTASLNTCTDDNAVVLEQYTQFLTSTDPAIEGGGGDATTYKTAARGRDFGLSEGKTLDLMLEHYNPRCQPAWGTDDLKAKIHNAFSYAQNPYGNALPETQFSKAPLSPKIRWDKTKASGLAKTVNNVVNFFLISTPGLTDSVAYNTFSGTVAVTGPFPWRAKCPKPIPRDWTDEDSVDFRYYLSHKWKFDPSINLIDDGVSAYARTKPFHPLQDYLTELTWDKIPRVDTFLIKHAKANDTAYSRAVCRLMLLQACKRAMNPGCKADYVVVFEGDQGRGKTQMLEVLGGEWYADIILDPHARDTVDAMRGKWIIEMAEMEVTRRAEVAALKAFISRSSDHCRLAYGRRSQTIERGCVFIGTMNPDALETYLTDTTGNRRYMPIRLGDIDLKAIAEIRDQLFAEAMELLRQGTPTWVSDKGLLTDIEAEQADRQTIDPWLNRIRSYLRETQSLPFIQTSVIWEFALNGAPHAFHIGHQKRIAHCLKHLGYVRKTRRVDGAACKVFVNELGDIML